MTEYQGFKLLLIAFTVVVAGMGGCAVHDNQTRMHRDLAMEREIKGGADPIAVGCAHGTVHLDTCNLLIVAGKK